MQLLFDIALLIGTFIQGRYLVILSFVFLPIVFGDCILVVFLIRIIIYYNDWPFLEATTFGLGDYTVGLIYAADTIVHTLPILIRGAVLLFGYFTVVRTIYRFYAYEEQQQDLITDTEYIQQKTQNSPKYQSGTNQINISSSICQSKHQHKSANQTVLPITTVKCSLSRNGEINLSDFEKSTCSNSKFTLKPWFTVKLMLWWFFSPLIPLLIYSCFFNPFIEYPTGLTLWQAIPYVLASLLLSQIPTVIATLTSPKYVLILDYRILKSATVLYHHQKHHYHHTHHEGDDEFSVTQKYHLQHYKPSKRHHSKHHHERLLSVDFQQDKIVFPSNWDLMWDVPMLGNAEIVKQTKDKVVIV